MFKKGLVIVIICTLIMTVCASPLSAEVASPNAVTPQWHFDNNGNICYGVFSIVHTGHIGAYQSGQHELEDGSICIITTLRLEHTNRCSKCDLKGEPFIADCQSAHSICGERTYCPY